MYLYVPVEGVGQCSSNHFIRPECNDIAACQMYFHTSALCDTRDITLHQQEHQNSQPHFTISPEPKQAYAAFAPTVI